MKVVIMRIAMIGVGYVGLVSGACFSEFGMDVVCVDKDKARIDFLNQGVIPIYEPGLDQLVARNMTAGHLSFTTDLKEALQGVDVVFIAVGTPSRRGNGHADLTYVFQAAREIADGLTDYAVVVTKSTVPVGTGRKVADVIRQQRPDLAFGIASNPEFLREGSAIDDFMRPDRVIIGVESEHVGEIMRSLYRPLHLIETPILMTTLETSELIKYAANSFLAMKITFINEIADLCEKLNADVHQVAKGIGLDGRIGQKFLHPGPGYGGSCFPKDTLALVRTAQEMQSPLQIIETVVQINNQRKQLMAERVIVACGGSVSGKKVAVLGLTFKPNTDDMRDSPSLDIIPSLQQRGAEIFAFDPEGMAEAKQHFQDITYCADSYQALNGADVLVIVTEWNQFRNLNLSRVKQLMKSPIIVDLRNIYEAYDMKKHGFTYSSIGRPA